MRLKYLIAALLILIFQSDLFSFSVPNAFWPQKDLPTAEYYSKTSTHKVLIASRKSAFKESLVSKIVTGLGSDSVYVKVTGIESISKEDLKQYSAIVLVNTCMAWSMENKVASVMKKNPDLKSYVVVTTAGDSGYVQKKTANTFDAISSASVFSNVDRVASKVLIAIRKLIHTTD